MMKKAITVVAMLGCLLALPGRGEEPAAAAPVEDTRAAALEVLEKAGAAAAKVRSVRFKAFTKPTGIVNSFVGSAAGEGYMEGWDAATQRPQKFWVHVQASPPGKEETSELTGGGDGETYFLIDHKNKKAYEDLDPGVLGTGGQTLQTIGLVQFVHPDPYQRELEGKSLELLGTEKVSGVECYLVKVAYAGGGPGGAEVGSIWSFSTEDYLPRRRVRQFAVPQQGVGELEIVLTDLEIDAEVTADLFKLKLPEGYEQIDDFAP